MTLTFDGFGWLIICLIDLQILQQSLKYGEPIIIIIMFSLLSFWNVADKFYILQS